MAHGITSVLAHYFNSQRGEIAYNFLKGGSVFV